MANKFQQAFGKRFRRIITNSPDGVPEWLNQIENGNDFGLFKPTDAPWVVHGDLATLVGGIRALLMQALHPGSLAGVAQHSRYEQDPLGRLAGTTKWLTILTFGSKEAIAQESARVNGMHKQVVGQYEDKPGHKKDYAASDQDLLLWVHIAFTDSFLIAHEFYGAKTIPNGSDAYVSLWSKAVEPLGLAKAPQTRNELKNAIKNFDPVLQKATIIESGTFCICDHVSSCGCNDRTKIFKYFGNKSVAEIYCYSSNKTFTQLYATSPRRNFTARGSRDC